MSTAKRMISLFIIATLTFCFLALIWTAQQEDVSAAVSKKVVKKARKYTGKKNKLFKIGGYWYCFRSRKVRKSLQKVGKNYYFFSKSTGKMYLRTGLKKVGTYYYYFKKSSGKAPAFRNKSWKDKDNKVWFFKSNGRRYGLSYKDSGSTAGNTAAGHIISAAAIKKDTKNPMELAYKKIVNRSKYIALDVKPITSSSVIGSYALTAAKKKGGKCYNVAALTFVTFKALNGNPSLVTGKCARSGDTKDNQDHAWVEESKLVYDAVFDLSKKEMAFMAKEKDGQGNKPFKLKGIADAYKNYLYTPDKQNTFK